MNDPNVNHPSHYTSGGIKCIDAIATACQNLTGEEAFCTASAIKYLWRWKAKGGTQDLEKAKWYIDRILQRYAPKPSRPTRPDCPNALAKCRTQEGPSSYPPLTPSIPLG